MGPYQNLYACDEGAREVHRRTPNGHGTGAGYAPQSLPVDETQGMETLINDISHLFSKEKSAPQARTDKRKSKRTKSFEKRRAQHSAS